MHKKTFFEICANKCNDPLFKPVSLVFDELHDDFLQSHELHDNGDFKVPFATSDKIKDQLSLVRYKVST